MLFAEHEFRRSKKTKDGATEGDHAESADKILQALGQKKVSVIPDAPPCPRSALYLWELFYELSLGISVNGMTPQLATWADIATWRKEMNVALEPWEKMALIRLGNLRFAIQSA